MNEQLQQLIVGIEALIKTQSDSNRLQETNLELRAAQGNESKVQTEALASLLMDLKKITATGNEAIIEVLRTHTDALAEIADLKTAIQALVSQETEKENETEKDDSEDKNEVSEALIKVNETLLQILEESKKKEQYDYEIEITPELFRKLKGKDGDDGKTPEKGKDYFTDEDKKELVSRATEMALARLRKDLEALKVPTAEEIIANIRERKLTIDDLDIKLPPDLTEAVSRLAGQINALKNGSMGTGRIGDLANVDLAGLQDGYALKYDAASKTWKPGPASGGGGSSTWGAITGDINTQADLIALLNGKSDVGHTHDDRYYTETEIDSQMAGKSNTGHTHTASEITDFDTAADARITAQKGNANGLATLDAGGKVPASQLPSYVDDVLEFADFASLPGTGDTGVIYVTLDTNKTYRWSGSAYIEISPSTGGGTVVETEIDFGTITAPNTSWTIVDAIIDPTKKILVFPSPTPATGRKGNDWEVDSAVFTGIAGSGQFTLNAIPNSRMVGARKIYYQVV